MDNTKSGVLRYLGHRNQEVPDNLSDLIDECISLMRDTATPRHVKLSCGIVPAGNGLALTGTGLVFRGESIARHLHGCDKAVLFAATLGAGADALILKWEHSDLTRSLVLDACATQLIEEYCDEVERQVRAKASESALIAARRFSPGYGDLALDIQPRIIEVLNANRRIGLTCTESFILLPRKSVTAIIGLGESPAGSTAGCTACAMRDTCEFRKDENADGCSKMA